MKTIFKFLIFVSIVGIALFAMFSFRVFERCELARSEQGERVVVMDSLMERLLRRGEIMDCRLIVNSIVLENEEGKIIARLNKFKGNDGTCAKAFYFQSYTIIGQNLCGEVFVFSVFDRKNGSEIPEGSQYYDILYNFEKVTEVYSPQK